MVTRFVQREKNAVAPGGSDPHFVPRSFPFKYLAAGPRYRVKCLCWFTECPNYRVPSENYSDYRN